MNNVWKKALAVLLCMMLLFTVVSGCAPKEEEPDDGKSTGSTTSTSASGDATDPSGDATDATGDVTDPSGDATDVTGDVTDPSGDVTGVTDPSGSATSNGSTSNSTKPTKKPTTSVNRPNQNPSVTVKTTTSKYDGKETTIKVGNLTVHSGATPYVSGGTLPITVMIPSSDGKGNMSKQAFTKTYEAQSGMKVDYQYYKHSDIFVLKSTMLNSGKIPDIFISVPVGFKSYEVAAYGKQGFFADLTDKLQTWAPNLYAKLNSGVYNYGRTITYANGTVYSLPQLHTPKDKQGSNVEEFQPMINTAWLEELELEIPTTMDEFYEVCKAFTKRDPDGNGKNDTYGYGAPLFSPQIWNPWGLGMSWYVQGAITEKGEVLYGPMTDNFREGCRFYNRMWEEGLMCKSMFGASKSAMKTLVSKTGIVSCSYISGYLNESELKDWTVMAWPKASNTGDFKAGITNNAYSDSYENMFLIGAGTKSPEACLRWLDYFYTPDGAMLWNFGPVGVAYTKVGNNYKLKKNSGKLAADQKVVASVSPMDAVNVLAKSSAEMSTSEKFAARIGERSMQLYSTNKWHFYWLDQLMNEEENAKVSKLKTPGDWNWGCMAIRGEVDIETDWNSYKNTYSTDYTAWKKIYQGVFNRFFK